MINALLSVDGQCNEYCFILVLIFNPYRLHRATWVSTELFLTFPPPALKAISIVPLNSEETGGRFRVWLNLEGSPPHLMWDRKTEGGFPELKILVSSRFYRHHCDQATLNVLSEAAHPRQHTAWEVFRSFRQEERMTGRQVVKIGPTSQFANTSCFIVLQYLDKLL